MHTFTFTEMFCSEVEGFASVKPFPQPLFYKAPSVAGETCRFARNKLLWTAPTSVISILVTKSAALCS